VSRWFRMYDEILDDPKVQKLPADLYRVWVNSLALCSRNGGRLPSVADCAFAFRETEASVSSAFHALKAEGLFVTVDETFQPKNWRKRQYKSDTSTDRVREFRKRSRNVTETAPDTETEAETEKNNKPRKRGYAFDGQVIKLTRRDFDVWCKSYPDVDLAAKLQSRDDWLAHEATEKDRERWFMSTSNWLANQQQKVSTDNRTAAGWDGMA
jgi:hypothetical protein